MDDTSTMYLGSTQRSQDCLRATAQNHVDPAQSLQRTRLLVVGPSNLQATLDGGRPTLLSCPHTRSTFHSNKLRPHYGMWQLPCPSNPLVVEGRCA
jgi:hypothetical protein